MSPLRGFFCDLDGTTPVDSAECLACAAAPAPPRGRRCRFTASILGAMVQADAARLVAGISATGLTGCLRQTYLSIATDYYAHPIKLFPALRGQLFHALFERAPADGLVRERRFAREIDGVVITGQPDEIDPARGLMVDYKTRTAIPPGVPEHYVAQLNVYRWIVADGYDLATGEPVRLPVEQLGIVFITMRELTKRPVPVWDLAETEAWVRPRARAIHEALEGGPWPAPVVPNPGERALCYDWCPHYQQCLRHP